MEKAFVLAMIAALLFRPENGMAAVDMALDVAAQLLTEAEQRLSQTPQSRSMDLTKKYETETKRDTKTTVS